jgi:hypothetical protein
MADDKLDYIIKVNKPMWSRKRVFSFEYIFGLNSASYGDFTLVALVALIVSRLKCKRGYQ